MKQLFVTYCRVSTKEQGDSKLGLEAQLETSRNYVKSVGGTIIAEYKDIQTGSSRERPALLAALEKCKETGAVLVFAKIDRLARDVEYGFRVKNSGVPLYFCDMPLIDTMTFGVMLTYAQHELEQIQQRTRSALNVIQKNIDKNGYHISKAGNKITRLGNAPGSLSEEHHQKMVRNSIITRRDNADNDTSYQDAVKVAKELRSKGATYKEICDTLNSLQGGRPRRGGKWHKGQISRILNPNYEKDKIIIN